MDANINLNIRLKTGEELDEAVEKFTNEVHHAAIISTPADDSPLLRHSSFHITYEIRQMIRDKRRLRKRWHISRNQNDKRLFNKACKDLRTLLHDHKNDKTSEFLAKINNMKHDEHLLWKATKYLKRPIKRNIVLKKSDDSWCRNDKDVSEEFATHLKNTFTPFAFYTPTQENEISEFLSCPLQMDFPIKHFTPNEVKNEIETLNKKKVLDMILLTLML